VQSAENVTTLYDRIGTHYASTRTPDVRLAIEHELRPVTALPVLLPRDCWDRLFGRLRSLPELDLGHRLLVAELGSWGSP
jgi:hypothetical protein